MARCDGVLGAFSLGWTTDRGGAASYLVRVVPHGAAGLELLFDTAPLLGANQKLTVSVKDKQGNVTRVDRTFSVGK